MEFSFKVNDVLSEEITLIERKNLLQSRNSIGRQNQFGIHNQQNEPQRHNLSKIIDALGIRSSQAQKLRGPITTSFKLKSSDDHLYILKEPDANNGLGTVVGMIRVGMKRLFLSDIYGQQHECQPLCVLDFYVHESKQRSGCGKKLFKHMTDVENVEAYELAIDRPSSKFLNFLSKHYDLRRPVHQVNKFVVFQPFFYDLEAIGAMNAHRRKSAPVTGKNLKNTTMIRPESRNANSASIIRTNRELSSRQSQKHVSNALNDLSYVPPLKPQPHCKNSINTPAMNQLRNLSTQVNYQNSAITDDQNHDLRSNGRHNQRGQNLVGDNASRLRMFSRHSIQQGSVGSPTVTRSQPPPKVSLDTRNHLTSQNYTVTHSRVPHQGRNITSVDNPFVANAGAIERDNERTDGEEVNYTMGLLNQLSLNRQTFGTSWNVFGVPRGGLSHPGKPYSRIQQRKFP